MLCPTNIMQECQELIDLNRFYIQMTSDCRSKFSYVPTSQYKILDDEFKTIWLSFKDSISALRHQNHEFNTLFTDHKAHIKQLAKKKEEFYMNLFLVISSTQIQMKNSIKKYMHLHRQKTISEQNNDFSHNFIAYVIELKHSEQQVLQSCDQIVEKFAFMNFELFCQIDYTNAISPMIQRVKECLQN